MMVTFVSQCEKKSLNKTRRVLDAFANRIGNRTWQTVITNEGLQAVKKLLRKTASKNTAVSCHWIRSRSRSELVWVIGNRNKFNEQGIVPVNFTIATELNIDEMLIMTDRIYANTHGQPLDQHLFAVGYLTRQIINRLIGDEDPMANTSYIAGCWHDMGKIDPTFQGWLAKELKKEVKPEDIPEDGQHSTLTGKFSFEKHPRHNEISLLLFSLLYQDKNINSSNKDSIKHAIYWHHAKPIRKTEFKKLDPVYENLKTNIGNDRLQEIYHAVTEISKKINLIAQDYSEDIPSLSTPLHTALSEDDVDSVLREPLAPYKDYVTREKIKDYDKKIKLNARNSLARSALVTADRFVSALNAEQLAVHIENKTLDSLIDQAFLKELGLKAAITDCLQGFEQKYPKSERNIEQAKAAEALSDEDVKVGVLNGPAGCGKTKIALEWAANTGVKKIVWICPRVQVCQGLVEDLTSKDYLQESVIEINTGEFKLLYQGKNVPISSEGKEFSGDVVITTIDQVLNSILTHRSVTTLVDYMSAHVVFDEFHEYINMPAFNLLFAELVACKKLQGEKSRALLVSATPNYLFVDKFLQIDIEYDLVGIPSFNQTPYKIKFTNFDETKLDETNPLYQEQSENSFVISNTATTAQLSFISNQNRENALLLHSKYTKQDKDDLFRKTFECFKRGGNHDYAVLRAGPIVQASLNISCGQMTTEFTSPENWLQRLGRLNRFAEDEDESLYITAIPETIAQKGKQIGRCAKFLGSLHSFQSAKAWREFLLDENVEDKSINLADIYQLYDEFYKTEKGRTAVEQDLTDALKKSVMVIDNKVIDPVSFPKAKKVKKDKIKKHSLRGDNRFVQMAVCKVDINFNTDYRNKYAYQEASIESHLTTSVEVICGYGDSNKDLLDFMVKKHHNIKGGKKSFKNFILLNEAREPITPIYLSYTPEDLKLVEASPHPHAIYYAIGDNQPIGAISINQLNSKKVN